MRKTRFFFLVLVVAGLVLPALPAADVNVSGDWELTVSSPRGEMTSEVSFVQEGEKLKVTMKGPRGESTGEGTIKGSDIEWTVTRTTPRGEMTVTYKGTVEGDTMSGEMQIGDFGSAEWKAARKK